MNQQSNSSLPHAAAQDGDGPELTARQKKLVAELTENPEVRAAAKAAGVGRTTAYRWLNEPAFRDALSRQRNAALSDALDTVRTHTGRAARELAGLLDSSNEWLRRQICKDILNIALRLRETEAIEQRLDALEKTMKDMNPNQRRW